MPKSLPKRFTDQASAREHLEGLLWPNGPICPHCQSVDTATKLMGKSTRPGVYWCNVCQKPFSVTVGTVYERSKVPLNTWLYATHLLCASKKGISSQQLARMLGVTVKTAWFMSHRIREAMGPASDVDPLGGLGQIVEADDTELGRSNKTRPRPRSKNLKFVSLVERGGRIRSKAITGTKGKIGGEIRAALYSNVNRASTLHTDCGTPLKTAWPMDRHSSVDHSKRFVGADADANPVHCNTAEGYFSIFKRGLVGTYQHMSEQHLPRYLNEFDFRMSYRVKLGYSDDMRADVALKGIAGKRLTYRRPYAA